ncbi:MAG: hypothetical protein IE885_01045 [Campylobacterales bacterium]|nr:hypothetical protein [Campylobacterales bacterium]
MKHYPNTEQVKWMIGLATYLCAIKNYIHSKPINTESNIKVRLVVNTYGILILDGMIEGKRHRFSTQKRATLWNILRYTCKSHYQSFLDLTWHKKGKERNHEIKND